MQVDVSFFFYLAYPYSLRSLQHMTKASQGSFTRSEPTDIIYNHTLWDQRMQNVHDGQ